MIHLGFHCNNSEVCSQFMALLGCISAKNGEHLFVKQVEYAVRKYKRHCCVPDTIWDELG